MSKLCPKCHQISVPPSGPKESPILIMGEFPGDAELKWGKPFVGFTGKVLKTELARFGLDIKQYRLANLWIHLPRKHDDELYEECWNFTLKVALRELQNRKGILLLGSDCAKTFVRKGVMEIAGLRVEDDCDLFKAEVVICSPNPAVVFQPTGVVGELRFALEQFSEAVDNYI